MSCVIVRVRVVLKRTVGVSRTTLARTITQDKLLTVSSRLADTRSPPAGQSFRGLIEIYSRYCGLSLLRTPNYVPRVSAITRVDCTRLYCITCMIDGTKYLQTAQWSFVLEGRVAEKRSVSWFGAYAGLSV